MLKSRTIVAKRDKATVSESAPKSGLKIYRYKFEPSQRGKFFCFSSFMSCVQRYIKLTVTDYRFSVSLQNDKTLPSQVLIEASTACFNRNKAQ